jgi:hypothetical protein
VTPPALHAKYERDHSAELLLKRGRFVFKKRIWREDVDFRLLTSTRVMVNSGVQRISSSDLLI